jgi:hypothetical protein
MTIYHRNMNENNDIFSDDDVDFSKHKKSLFKVFFDFSIKAFLCAVGFTLSMVLVSLLRIVFLGS